MEMPAQQLTYGVKSFAYFMAMPCKLVVVIRCRGSHSHQDALCFKAWAYLLEDKGDSLESFVAEDLCENTTVNMCAYVPEVKRKIKKIVKRSNTFCNKHGLPIYSCIKFHEKNTSVEFWTEIEQN